MAKQGAVTKLIGGVAALVVILVIVLVLNLNTATKALIETVGTETLKTDVKLSGLDISLKNQTVALSGLTIRNPEGFQAKDLLKVGEIKVAAGDLTGDTIVLNEVTLRDMEVTYELGTGGSNLGKVKSNIRTSPGSSGGDDGAGKSVVIKSLNIEGARLIPALVAGGKGTSAPVPLPPIRLSNIGSQSRPASAPEAIARVLNEIIRVSVATASREGLAKSLEGASGVLNKSGDTAKDIGDKAGETLKGFFK